MKSPSIHRTPLYRAKAAYANMKRRCNGGVACESAYKNVHLKMTLEEWLRWSVPEYEKFLDTYPGETPCVSRNDDIGDYKLGNVRIISSRQNRKEQVAKGVQNIHRRIKCSCGSIFESTKSYAGHKRWCDE